MNSPAEARARLDTATLEGHQTKIELCDLVKNSWQISTPVTRRQTTSLIGLKRSTRFERTIRNVFPAPGIPETWVNVSEDRIYTTRLHLQMPGRKKNRPAHPRKWHHCRRQQKIPWSRERRRPRYTTPSSLPNARTNHSRKQTYGGGNPR